MLASDDPSRLHFVRRSFIFPGRTSFLYLRVDGHRVGWRARIESAPRDLAADRDEPISGASCRWARQRHRLLPAWRRCRLSRIEQGTPTPSTFSHDRRLGFVYDVLRARDGQSPVGGTIRRIQRSDSAGWLGPGRSLRIHPRRPALRARVRSKSAVNDSLIWIAIVGGGATGALLRGAIFRAIELWSAGDPNGAWAKYGSARSTLAVNVLGSLLLGLLVGGSCAPLVESSDPLHTFWGAGICGALTTFSTLCADVMTLARAGETTRGAGVLAANVVLGMLALVIGLAAAS